MGLCGWERDPDLASSQQFGLVFDSQKRPVKGEEEDLLFSTHPMALPFLLTRPGLLHPTLSCLETACLSDSTRQLLNVTGLGLRAQGLYPVL